MRRTDQSKLYRGYRQRPATGRDCGYTPAPVH
jgi:hypothetical protein